MKKIKKFKTEISNLKQQFSSLQELSKLKQDASNLETDNFMTNTELVKDVESMIITEPDEEYQNHQKHIKSCQNLRNFVLPENLQGSVLTEKMHPTKNGNNEFINLMNESKHDPQNKLIYQLFFENVETFKTEQLERKEKQSSAPRDSVLTEKYDQFHFLSEGKTQERNVNQERKKSSLKSIPINKSNQIIKTPITHKSESQNDDLRLFLHGYIKLPANPIFNQKENIFSLKASSFFTDSVLFENEELIIYCKTQNEITLKDTKVTLLIDFIAKKDKGLFLTTNLESYNSVLAEPHAINQAPLLTTISQRFTIQFPSKAKIIDFPTLRIKVSKGNQNKVFSLLLPFSVNKYLKEVVQREKVLEVYSKGSVLLEHKFEFDEVIVGNVLNFKKWFESSVGISENGFLVGFFGANGIKFVIEIEIGKRELKMRLKCVHEDVLMLNFFQWFIWVFGKD